MHLCSGFSDDLVKGAAKGRGGGVCCRVLTVVYIAAVLLVHRCVLNIGCSALADICGIVYDLVSREISVRGMFCCLD